MCVCVIVCVCFSSLNLGAKRKLTSKMAAGHIQPMLNSHHKTAGVNTRLLGVACAKNIQRRFLFAAAASAID